jgi:urea transport system permease protein
MAEALNALYAIAVLLIVASGLGLTLGFMRVINFAHGEFVMLGAFGAIVAADLGSFWLGLLVGPLIALSVGLIVEGVVIRRLYQRPLETILATFGVGLLIREVVKVIAGPEFRSVRAPFRGTVELLGVSYPTYQLFFMGAVALTFASLVLLLRATRLGLTSRAVIQNPEIAAALGINVSRAYQVTFALGAALAGLAGALLSPNVAIHPEMGTAFVVDGFLAVVVGGAGSFAGLVTSTSLLGAAQSLTSSWISPIAGSLAIVLLTVVLMRLRPAGILRGR